jgi:hypothetical protein
VIAGSLSFSWLSSGPIARRTEMSRSTSQVTREMNAMFLESVPGSGDHVSLRSDHAGRWVGGTGASVPDGAVVVPVGYVRGHDPAHRTGRTDRSVAVVLLVGMAVTLAGGDPGGAVGFGILTAVSAVGWGGAFRAARAAGPRAAA